MLFGSAAGADPHEPAKPVPCTVPRPFLVPCLVPRDGRGGGPPCHHGVHVSLQRSSYPKPWHKQARIR